MGYEEEHFGRTQWNLKLPIPLKRWFDEQMKALQLNRNEAALTAIYIS